MSPNQLHVLKSSSTLFHLVCPKMSPTSWPRWWEEPQPVPFLSFQPPCLWHQGLGGGIKQRKHVHPVGVIIIQPTCRSKMLALHLEPLWDLRGPKCAVSAGPLVTSQPALLISCSRISTPQTLTPGGSCPRPTACRSGVSAGWLQPCPHCLLQFTSVHREESSLLY